MTWSKKAAKQQDSTIYHTVYHIITVVYIAFVHIQVRWQMLAGKWEQLQYGQRYSLSSMADLCSAWLSMSLENHSLNSSWESNSVGMMKCSRAHSWETAITHGLQHFCRVHMLAQTRTHMQTLLTSAMVFWIGVPVSSSLFRHWNCSRIFHRTLKWQK